MAGPKAPLDFQGPVRLAGSLFPEIGPVAVVEAVGFVAAAAKFLSRPVALVSVHAEEDDFSVPGQAVSKGRLHDVRLAHSLLQGPVLKRNGVPDVYEDIRALGHVGEPVKCDFRGIPGIYISHV